MKVRRARFGDAGLDQSAVLTQMDNTVAQLRAVWNDINSRWAVLLTQGLVQATDARMASLAGLIDDLDVGGVAREHVFFPLDGQTQDEAWGTWVDTANYVRAGLQQVGGVITNWSLSTVLPRVVGDVGNTFEAAQRGLMWLVGGVVAVQVLQLLKGEQKRRAALSGYARRRRHR